MVFAAHKVHAILLNKADVLRVQVQPHAGHTTVFIACSQVMFKKINSAEKKRLQRKCSPMLTAAASGGRPLDENCLSLMLFCTWQFSLRERCPKVRNGGGEGARETAPVGMPLILSA